jgi:hypothetical protein
MIFPIQVNRKGRSPAQNSGPQLSIANSQQGFPLAKLTLEAHALGNLKRRDHATLDLLSTLSGALASRPIFPTRPVQVSREFVVLAGLELGQQLLDGLAHLGEFLNERVPVHS